MTLPSGVIRGNERGATLVEFAFVAPLMMLMLCGTFDLAQQAYARTVLEGTVEKAGRDATLENGAAAVSNVAFDQAILAKVKRVTGTGASHNAQRLSYSDFSQVSQPERFVDRAPLNNRYDAGECFEDENGNGAWDADMGRVGQGGAQDVVVYRMTVTYPRLFPMAGLLGWSRNQSITATTILRNQPFRNQSKPPVTRCP